MPLLLPSWLQGTKYIFQHRFLQFSRGVKSETRDDSLNYRPLIIFTSARRILHSNHNNKQIKFQMNLFLPNEIIISRLNVTKETKVVINLMQQNIKDTWYVQITEKKLVFNSCKALEVVLIKNLFCGSKYLTYCKNFLQVD